MRAAQQDTWSEPGIAMGHLYSTFKTSHPHPGEIPGHTSLPKAIARHTSDIHFPQKTEKALLTDFLSKSGLLPISMNLERTSEHNHYIAVTTTEWIIPE